MYEGRSDCSENRGIVGVKAAYLCVWTRLKWVGSLSESRLTKVSVCIVKWGSRVFYVTRVIPNIILFYYLNPKINRGQAYQVVG